MKGAKFGITDEAFLPKMIEACSDDEERGMVYILFYTGMHGSILTKLTLENLMRQGDEHYLRWARPKTKRLMEALMPTDKLPIIVSFLKNRKKSLQWYNVLLGRIGTRAGFDGVSSMTFRHTFCIRLILDGMPLPFIRQKMGCTAEVIERAYGRLTPEQLRGLMR